MGKEIGKAESKDKENKENEEMDIVMMVSFIIRVFSKLKINVLHNRTKKNRLKVRRLHRHLLHQPHRTFACSTMTHYARSTDDSASRLMAICCLLLRAALN